MPLDELAKQLSSTSRLGMTPELAEKIGIRSEEVVRGQLMAVSDGDRGPLGVYLLAIYVVDDTDLFGDGEIYWWSVAALVDRQGSATWSPVSGLPAGAPPHKCGSLEWMTNVSLKDPPLLAVVPADEDTAACVIRLAVYDDDSKPADLGAALRAGYGALATCKRDGLPQAAQILTPVADAIFKSLVASEDDVLIDEDITLRKGGALRFNAGLIGTVVTAKAHAYYVVKDELGTDTAGPVVVRKGEVARLAFASDVVSGGRVSIFARGADVDCPLFGTLTTDRPFAGKVLDAALARSLAGGFDITGRGAAKVVAFYTPP